MNMERLYSLKTASETLGISKRTLLRIIEREGIKAYRVGSQLRLTDSQLIEIIKPAEDIAAKIINNLPRGKNGKFKKIKTR